MPKRARYDDALTPYTQSSQSNRLRMFGRMRRRGSRYSRRTPRYRTPSTEIYSFRRTILQNINLFQAGGWNNTGFYDLGIFPSLARCEFVISGALAFQPVMPNVTEFINLFDQYMIRKCTVSMTWSGTDTPSNATGYTTPTFHIVSDYNSTGNLTLTDYQQYPDMKTITASNGKKITWSFVPRCRLDVLTDTGITSTSAANKAYQWIDTSANTVQHLGARVFFNNFNRNNAFDLGTMIMEVSYDIDFKFVR